MSPLLILLAGLVTVVGLIVVFRVNAFFALIAAALLVSLLAPGAWDEKVARVAAAFGTTAGSIGIVIALAAVIGRALMDSGAADRIVRWFLSLLGAERGATALLSSGFVLAVPVFFDTVFYLLVPLARSMYRRTGGRYLRYLLAIAGGAMVTHILVPPTPGPLIIADTLGVDVGMMMLMGTAIGLPAAAVSLWFAGWLDARMPVPMRAIGEAPEPEPLAEDALPGLALSLTPILLPVVLISSNTIIQVLATGAAATNPLAQLAGVTAIAGNPNLALFLACIAALWVYRRTRRPTAAALSKAVEDALMSGGLIILITAAGGAFGAMLKAADIGPALQGLFPEGPAPGGYALLPLAFLLAALLKMAQGSSTVAMITASAMLAAMLSPDLLGFHPVYLATAVGSGAGVGSWMNDSGFWIFARMGGLTEVETLRSWTLLSVLLGTTGFVVTLLLAFLFPMG